ncbi:MAG: hypothetical protein GXN93_00445 [Candidatus Diapherotrites archaeon]|nr:hypothetical protein [Candidatus Diapherotrites archaeon]
MRTVAERAVADGFSQVLFVLETKGNPSAIRVLRADPAGWEWVGQLYISGVSLARDRGVRVPRIRADGLCVRAQAWRDALENVFLPNCDDDSVSLLEEDGHVRFEYGGREIGPRFEVTGWDAVPTALDW